ncbi:MAG TPA: hypothetical protein PKJ45_08080 [Rubrivivax sp.]|nr:hypothetical protein [Rubrivivax sp.]
MIDKRPATPARPYPSFQPYIVARPLAHACAECKKPGPHALALLHLTSLPELGQMVRSIYPLCARCAAAARRRGWPALATTWCDLSNAPHAIVGQLRMPTQGGTQ